MVFRSNRCCPHCGGELVPRRTRSFSYESCGRCQGLWVSIAITRAMIDEMVPGAAMQFVNHRMPAQRRCPDCTQPLTPVTLFTIPVDYCRDHDHGLWFDKDELQQVLDRVGDTDPPPPEPPTSFTSLLQDFFRA